MACTTDETEAIARHCDKLAKAVEKNIAKFRAIPKDERGDWENGQLGYWLHARGVLKWVKSTADTKAAKASGAKAYGG